MSKSTPPSKPSSDADIEQYAPWSDDTDEDEPLMTLEEIAKADVKGMLKLMREREQREAAEAEADEGTEAE